MNKTLILNFESVGFKEGFMRFLGSAFRTVIAALATFALGQLANLNLADLVNPEHLTVATIVFTAVRSLLSFLATWATTTPVVLPAGAEVVAVEEVVPHDQPVS